MATVLLGFVGDVLVNRQYPSEVFGAVREILSTPDILFGNLEGAYTDDPRPVPSAFGVLSAPAHNLEVYADVGFDVLSLANNHIVDAGYEAMLETRARLRNRGVKTCGAGSCIDDARLPALIEANGLRVAFLAYASIFPIGCEARSSTPGIVPMRAYNHWREPFSSVHAPGARPLIATVPDQADLALLNEDILRAKEQANVVIMSFHWGDHTRAFHLTDHETRTARHCIDQGADMVVGHHHHALRGMEWYKGKPIMYGLGHFVFDLRSDNPGRPSAPQKDLGRYFEQIEFAAGPREGWPLLPMPEDTRMTLMAWATADRDGIASIGFIPCKLTPDGLVHPLDLDLRDFAEVVDYLEKCNRTQHLRSRIVLEGALKFGGRRSLAVVPS